MRITWPRLPLLLFLVLPAGAQALDLLVYPNPGVFNVSAHDEVSGPGAAVLQRLAQVTGLPLRQRPMPAARALQMILQQPGQCAAGVPRTADREHQLRWAGLMASGALTLYGRSDETREVGTPDDLRGAVVVAQRESVAVTWLRERGLNVYEVNDTLTGLRMLRAGRVDYWLVNDLPARYVIQHHDGPAPKPLHEFGRIELYLACHRSLDEATAERLRRGFEELRRKGELVEFGLR